MTLADLQRRQKAWSLHNFGPTPDTAEREAMQTRPILGLVEEVGELCHAVLKMNQGIRGNVNKHMDDMMDAVGDIVIYLSDVCTRFGIDFDATVESVWEMVERRDWVLFPKNGLTE